MNFVAPTIDYIALLPFLIVLGAACLGMLMEAFIPRKPRFAVQVVIALLAVVAALVTLVWRWAIVALGDPAVGKDGVVTGTVMIDGVTHGFWAILLVFTALSLGLFAERRLHEGGTAFTPMAAAIPGSKAEEEARTANLAHSEVFPLTLFSASGMLLFVAANNLLVLFVALEILSLPLYVLCGLARHRRALSQEAALKYFLLGAASSAMFLFGVACLFGYAGGFGYEQVAQGTVYSSQSIWLLIAGMTLVAVGILFKLGAVPFQSWVPDVYQGAPTPVTAFMSVCTKVAAVGGALRLFYVALGGARWTWMIVIACIAVLTMVVGAIIAINQRDVKRILAYSAVAHAGFILVPLVGMYAPQSEADATGFAQITSTTAIMFYLAAYGFATIGAFAVVTLVRASGREATSLDAWAGVGRRHPVIGVAMVLFLLSLAGIPLTGGFVGKLVAFMTAWQGGFWWLALIGVAVSLVAVFLYVRIIQVMYFQVPQTEDNLPDAQLPGVATWIVLAVCAVGTLALGLVPGPVMDLFRQVSAFVIPVGQ